MDITVDSWAWLKKSQMSPSQVLILKRNLTIVPKKMAGFPGEDSPEPIYLFSETPERIGVARQYFLAKNPGGHAVSVQVCDGEELPSDLVLNAELRDEQRRAITSISTLLRNGGFGGILRAAPGWGKTVAACALMAEMQVPTLVVVHKEFLVSQWKQRILQFLPMAKVGIVQQDVCDYEGKHVVIAMVHSLAAKRYPPGLYRHFGLVLTDECHRIGAQTWSAVPAQFPSRWRLGLSATPRRKDGADNVFLYHLGPVLFTATEQRMKPRVRRVWTSFALPSSPVFNRALASKPLLLRFLCASPERNKQVIEQLVLALVAGRKVLVLSERLNHLKSLHDTLKAKWPSSDPFPTVGYYVGGMDEENLGVSSKCQVIFATTQMVSEGLDIPALDTLFLTCPMGDVEQAVGRILRPSEGKKEPVVVDFIDSKVSLCKRLSEARGRFYSRQGWAA